MSAYQPDVPVEDVNRGTVVALLALPVGVILWVLVWSLGFIVSIITFGVAYLAMFLYRLGSGGTIGRAGAVRVAIITLVTLALAIFAGLVADVAIGIGSVTGVGPVEALGNPAFGEVFTSYITDPESGLLLNLGLAIGFGLLGCFGILRSAFSATAEPAPAFGAPTYPSLAQPNTGQGQAFQGYGQQAPAPYDPTQPTQPQYNPEQYEPQQPLGQAIPGVPQFPSQVQPAADGQPQPGVQYPNPPGYQPEAGEQQR